LRLNNISKKFSKFVFIGLLVALLAACGNGANNKTGATAQPVKPNVSTNENSDASVKDSTDATLSTETTEGNKSGTAGAENLTTNGIANNEHSVFEGNIGTEKARMDIFRKDKEITANYITQNDNTEVNLTGTLDNQTLNLVIIENSKIFGTLTGTINSDGTISGKYDADGDDSNGTFSLSLVHSLGDTFETRYSGFNTEEVEAFAQKIKSDIVSDNVSEVSNRIDYPINVSINGVLTEIKSAQEFEQHYSEIISLDLKDKISGAYTRYLFSNFQGIMLGDGEIWFSEAEGKEGLWIIAINN